MNKMIWKRIISVLSVLATAAFPVLFLYCSNAEEAGFVEILKPLFIFCGIGGLALAISLIVMKSPMKAAATACLFVLAFSNYTLIEQMIQRLFSQLQYWHIMPVVFVCWLHVAYFIWKKLPEEICADMVSVLCFVMCSMIALNFALCMPKILSKLSVQKKLMQSKAQASQSIIQADTEMPNVYVILFDEYAGFKQISQYYGYENKELQDYLTEKGFTISMDSHNECVNTNTIVTNLVNLDYVVELDTPSGEKSMLRHQGELYSLMREHGYQLIGVESGTFLGLESRLNNQGGSSALTVSGEDMAYLCYQKTPLYPFNNLNVSKMFRAEQYAIDYLKKKENIPTIPSFTFVYVNMPHEPFYVDENGNGVLLTEYHNWRDDRYYLGQFKYATKQMINILDNILRWDDDSIIVLMSDHGARASSDPELFMKKFPLEVMNNPLMAVYYRGKPMTEIKGLSGVNVLRRVVSRLFDMDYAIVEVPEGMHSSTAEEGM